MNSVFVLRALAARKSLQVRSFRRCEAAGIAAIGSWRSEVCGRNLRVADKTAADSLDLNGRFVQDIANCEEHLLGEAVIRWVPPISICQWFRWHGQMDRAKKAEIVASASEP